MAMTMKKLDKRTKNKIRYSILLAATIILYVSAGLLILALLYVVLKNQRVLQDFDPSDVLFLVGIFGGAIICTVLNNKYRPINMIARVQKKKISGHIASARTFELDEQEHAVIKIKVNHDLPWKSAFSTDDEPALNPEVAEYLEDRLTILNTDQEFTLVVDTDMDREEQEAFTKALRNYYAARYVVLKAENNKSTRVAILFIVLGVAVILASIVSQIYNSIIQTVLNIVGTVFIWEATYILFVHRMPIFRKKMRYLMLANMDINFKTRD